jgi:hypothetical protein
MADIRFRWGSLAGCLTLLLALQACAQSTIRLSPDFGAAVSQDLAAQIADPDARYMGIPAPGANGLRTGLAQTRYDRNQVVQPLTTTATSGIQNQGAPGAGAGAGVGAGTQ